MRSSEPIKSRNKNPTRSNGKCNTKACTCECHSPDMSEFIWNNGDPSMTTKFSTNGEKPRWKSAKELKDEAHNKWKKRQHDGPCK